MKLSALLFLEDGNTEKIPDFEFYQFFPVRMNEIKVNTFETISKLIRKNKIVCIITVGNPKNWVEYIQLPFEWRKRWIHVNELEDLCMDQLTHCYIGAENHKFDKEHPLISVITTTFHSGDKFLRPLKSLKSQTYSNWEWVIWDDSKDDFTFNQVLSHAEKDIRIQCYKAPQHSGFIGEMKRLSSVICKGKWIVELDHDDIIIPELFQMIVDIDKKYPDTDFIYSDFIELYEGTEEPFHYGEYFGFGYGSYTKQLIRGNFHNVCSTPPINPTTLRHIVGVPNHVRIWKTSFYHKIGQHMKILPIVDDYELLLRTFFESKNWVRIPMACYYQYRNTGGNNFTFLRNALIQYITAWISMLYREKIDNRIEELGWDNIIKKKEVAWEREGEDYSFHLEKIYHPSINENTVSIVIPCFNNIKKVDEKLREIMKTRDDDNYFIYIIGDCCPQLSFYMNTQLMSTNSHLNPILNKIYWWNLFKRYDDEFKTCINYAKKMVVFTEKIEILEL